MSKLVVTLLAISLMAFICSTQVNYGVFGRNSRRAIKEIMEKKPEDRNWKEEKIIVEAANKALADASIMDIESAIDVFRCTVNDLSYLRSTDAEMLYNITNISKDKCNDGSLPSSGLLLMVTENKHKFPVLYEHAKNSLNHYMDVCGLEDRYRDFVQWQASKNPGNPDDHNQLTLTDRTLGELIGPAKELFVEMSLTAMKLMGDPDLTSVTRCNDSRFVSKLVKGLLSRFYGWAYDYVSYVLDSSRKICGQEDLLIRDADRILGEYHPDRIKIGWVPRGYRKGLA